MRITILPRPLQVRIRAPRLSGCWRWAGSVTPAGYARFNGRYAHRVAWVHVNGQIPERMVLHHACGTRECVRPDHLRLVERGPHIAEHAASPDRLASALDACRLHAGGWPWRAAVRLAGRAADVAPTCGHAGPACVLCGACRACHARAAAAPNGGPMGLGRVHRPVLSSDTPRPGIAPPPV